MNKQSILKWDDYPNTLSQAFDPKEAIIRHQNDEFCEHSYMSPKEDLGNGYQEYFQFNDGLRVHIMNCYWNRELEYLIDDGNYIRFNFSLDINISVNAAAENWHISNSFWRVINPKDPQSSHQVIAPFIKNAWVTLIFSKAYLQALFEKHSSNDSNEFWIDASSNYREIPSDNGLNLVTGQILNLRGHESIRNSIAYNKAKELLYLAIDRLISIRDGYKHSKIHLSQANKNAIKDAKDLLLSNLERPPTVKELCTAVGINRNKLHYGFKSEFGLTPQQLLDETRLAKAYYELQGSDKKIYEIAMDIGYSNQASFTTAFKRKYGLTPNKARLGQYHHTVL